MSSVLAIYFARQYLLNIGLAFLGLCTLFVLFDLVEHARRSAGNANIGIGAILELSLLHVPYLAQRILPYAVLVGSMLALRRLTRHNELVVARASGISTWQLLNPGFTVVVFIGLLAVAALNPLSSALLARYEQLNGKLFDREISSLSVSDSGFWLRQADGFGESVIHARRIAMPGPLLEDVVIFRFREKDEFFERIDAQTAQLMDGYWALNDAQISGPGRPVDRDATFRFDTNLTVNRIQESFASPETLSFWQMPEFIALLERAGFSSLKHRVHWHKLLATPLLFAGMVMVGAIFSLRLTRRGGTGLLIGFGVMFGLIFHAFSDVALALGLSARVPAVLSAWAPAVTSVLVGSGFLLYARTT